MKIQWRICTVAFGVLITLAACKKNSDGSITLPAVSQPNILLIIAIAEQNCI